MRLICFLLVLGFFQFNCSQSSKNLNWTEVKSPKAGFSVDCPDSTNSSDSIPIEFDEKKKTGNLFCQTNEIEFFVHSWEWNVSENPQENSDRFFESLNARGIGESRHVMLNHDGSKAVQSIDPAFRTVEQHFIVGKTAFHLSVAYQNSKTQQAEKSKLTDEQMNVAQRFFDSFKLL